MNDILRYKNYMLKVGQLFKDKVKESNVVSSAI